MFVLKSCFTYSKAQAPIGNAYGRENKKVEGRKIAFGSEVSFRKGVVVVVNTLRKQ